MGAETFMYPTPLVLCGTYDSSGRPNLATLAWAGVCCSVPPAVQVSIRKERLTYESLMAKKEFTVNIPSHRQAAQADFCGMTSGRSVDKFARAWLSPLRGQHVDAPIVDEFPFCLECRLIHTFKIGSHDIFIGEILASWVREDCLDESGAPDPLKISPIAFAGGMYYSISAPALKAFDIGKSLIGQ